MNDIDPIRLERERRLSLWLHYGTFASRDAEEKILTSFDSPEEAFDCAKRGERDRFPAGDLFDRLRKTADENWIDGYEEELRALGISYVIPAEAAYPSLLREIPLCPTLLFYKGTIRGEIDLPIAMIGSRVCTDYGKEVALLFAERLSEAGATVISGMADGIDGCAARGALACKTADYPTAAVVGTGLDLVYPAIHRRLCDEIIERGCVISEYLPGTRPLKHNFPARNRIISGMSRGVVVVEAGERSGTSITAGFALDQGRDVFAVPGRITDLQSYGANRLIQRGEAKPVFCADDILEEYRPILSGDRAENARTVIPLSALPEAQQAIVNALRRGERSADEIAELTGLPGGILNSSLTELEFSGIIMPQSGRRYSLNILEVRVSAGR